MANYIGFSQVVSDSGFDPSPYAFPPPPPPSLSQLDPWQLQQIREIRILVQQMMAQVQNLQSVLSSQIPISMAATITKTQKPQLSSLANLITKPVTQSSSDPDITRIKSIIRSEPDPDRLTSLFLSSFTNPQFHSDRAFDKLSIQKLAKSKRSDLINQILETQKSDPTLLRSEGFLIRLMTLSSEAAMVDHAVCTFEFTPKAGIKHSPRSLCALLIVFLKNNMYDRLFESFCNVPNEVDVSLNVTAYNLAMLGKCENGDVDGAHKLFDEMVEKHYIFDPGGMFFAISIFDLKEKKLPNQHLYSNIEAKCTRSTTKDCSDSLIFMFLQPTLGTRSFLRG